MGWEDAELVWLRICLRISCSVAMVTNLRNRRFRYLENVQGISEGWSWIVISTAERTWNVAQLSQFVRICHTLQQHNRRQEVPVVSTVQPCSVDMYLFRRTSIFGVKEVETQGAVSFWKWVHIWQTSRVSSVDTKALYTHTHTHTHTHTLQYIRNIFVRPWL
jgi:hypothetical protein